MATLGYRASLGQTDLRLIILLTVEVVSSLCFFTIHVGVDK